MQSEEIDKNKTESPPAATEMTYSDKRRTPSPSSRSTTLQGFSFDPVKLEADIELEESSRSSDTEELRSDLLSPKMPPDVFPMHDQNPDESIRSWLQRITQIQSEIQKKLERGCGSSQMFSDYSMKSSESVQTTSRVVKYQDLPYMGEMTLDNSKPRRGRKPKKADICHLIYKNYGTILPGTPNAKSLLEKEGKKGVLDSADVYNRSDVQNRIISSLLEKRLTQESKSASSRRSTQLTKDQDQNEPLNLCIRDLNHLKIRLMKNKEDVAVKSEPTSDDEVEFVHETPSPSTTKSEPKFPSFLDPSTSSSSKTPEEGPNGYVYWPNAGVFIHPMALQQHLMYYQRLAANSSYTLPSHSPRPPPDSGGERPELKKIAPKQKKRPDHEPEAGSSDQKAKRNAPSSSEKTPTKRKRSAIFIPPIPAENQTNPATEVSICKFKFTGGAKPSLQEKKMLSVDSGGNFRYYSGTGDKSMRGYEFFPRETLQQQVGNSQGSSTGAFLQASGERIYPGSPIDFPGRSTPGDFLLTPELPSPGLASSPDASLRMKKRKSRKSLQREKLEQTFKEKGFLIQTQQLESAEGATYCKFRQLRKFTRYLFRSWKDYLPGNVRELQEGEKSETDDVPESELDNLSRQSSNSGVIP